MSNANVDLAKVTISILVDFDKKLRFSISILRSSQHYYSLCDFVYTCNACRLQLLVLIRAGMAAECQVERSQIRNKEIALTVLRSRCVALSLSFPVGGRGVSRPRSTPERTTCVEGRLNRCSWLMIAPARVTGSKVEDAAPSRHRHRSVGTLETVVVQYGEGSWPEVDSDLFSAEQR